MASIRARPLTAGEERKLLTKDGKSISFSGPLSIMGPSDHTYVNSTVNSDQVRMKRIYLDAGQYFDEIYGCGPAQGGTSVDITWSTSEPLHYLKFIARELEIPYFTGHTLDVIYFQTKYEDIFAKCAAYVDHQMMRYVNSRSAISRWLGMASGPEWDSKEAEEIRSGVRRILKNANVS